MIPEDSIKGLISFSTAEGKPKGWGARHTLAILAFFGFAASYAMRFNLSIAIVAMVRRNRTEPPKPPSNHSYLYEAGNNTSSGEFDWDEVQQGVILGAFFWGYFLTQLPGGLMSQRFGGKWPFGLGMLLTAIFALLTPLAARTSVGFLIFVRIVQGLGEGLCTPAMHNLLASWAPPAERGGLASIAYSGTSFGSAVTMIVSGYLIEANVWGGWPSVFYVTGGISLVWFILWSLLVTSRPSDHPRIKQEELHYILRAIGNQISKGSIPTPWKQIATSMPMWVILISHTGHTWGLYTLLTELPTYMQTVLHFNIKENSWMSAIPYFVMLITAVALPLFAEYMIEKKWLKTVNVRKIMQVIAHVGAALALIGASFSGSTTLTIILLTTSVGANGASFAGFGVNHVDIAANHAGVLMGITNTVANCCGIIAPYVAGLLTNGQATVARWRIVFFIAAAIYIVDTIIYLIFASSDEQPWNRVAVSDKSPLLAPTGNREYQVTPPSDSSDDDATQPAQNHYNQHSR